LPVALSSSQINRIFRFNEFEFSVRAGELRRNGSIVRLQQQPLRVLLALLEYQGEVITRSELGERVWPGDSVQDVDNSMRVAINKLRQALGDDPDNPRYIETLTRRGYRWLCPVTVCDSPPTAIDPQPTESLEHDKSLSRVLTIDSGGAKRGHGGRIRGVVVALVLLAAMYGISRWMHTNPDVAEPQLLPLTTYSGLEYMPSISRDGKYVAFQWTGPNATGPYSVYFKRIGDERPIRLTDTPVDAADGDPVWAPDGKTIYFFRRNGEQSGIYVKSTEGGVEHLVVGTSLGGRRMRRARFDVSPDGQFLAYPDAVAGQNTSGLFLFDLKKGQLRQITNPPANSEGDGDPAFSHDGKSIAFQRDILDGQLTYVVPSQGGTARILIPSGVTDFVDGIAWTADDNELLLGGSRLRRVSATGAGNLANVQSVVGAATFPALVGGELAYVEATVNANIWKIDLRTPTHAAGEPVKLISSTRQQAAASFSPDGSRIAFQSDRSGAWEIWVCNRNGSDPVQLTHFGGPLAGTPRWSPDGKYLAFDAVATGMSQIYKISADGGEPRRLTDDQAGGHVPTWSRDGNWIYYSTIRNGEAEIMKLPAAGGAPQPVTSDGGVYPVESEDGKYLYFSRSSHDSTVWRMPVAGGAEETIPGMPKPVDCSHWALTNTGIYLVNGNGDLEFYQLHKGTVSVVLHDQRMLTDWSMAVSPDGREVIWTQIDDRAADLMLVKNFR